MGVLSLPAILAFFAGRRGDGEGEAARVEIDRRCFTGEVMPVLERVCTTIFTAASGGRVSDKRLRRTVGLLCYKFVSQNCSVIVVVAEDCKLQRSRNPIIGGKKLLS